MKPLNFSKPNFNHYEYFYSDLIEHSTHKPSTTKDDFWRNTYVWLNSDIISVHNKSISFTNRPDLSFGNTFKCLDGGASDYFVALKLVSI